MMLGKTAERQHEHNTTQHNTNYDATTSTYTVITTLGSSNSIIVFIYFYLICIVVNIRLWEVEEGRKM